MGFNSHSNGIDSLLNLDTLGVWIRNIIFEVINMYDNKKSKFSAIFDVPRSDDRSCSSFLNFNNEGLLKLSAGLFCLFVVAEFGGAYYSGSLGLIGDASAM